METLANAQARDNRRFRNAIRLLIEKWNGGDEQPPRAAPTSEGTSSGGDDRRNLGFRSKENSMNKISQHSLVSDRADLEAILSEHGRSSHYVYMLRFPDGVECHGGVGTPFYVGIGQGNRVFAHEGEARDPTRSSAKVEAIRSIWNRGLEVIRTIDGVHDQEPWDREEELINEIGCLADGRGPLTNSQTYSRSSKLNGVELRKYDADHVESGDETTIPTKFKLRNVRLMAGPRAPRSRMSVFGKIFSVLEENPGVTGEELVGLLFNVDFTGNKSAYTQSGRVSSSWLIGYIEGGFFRKDRLHIQRF